MKTSTIVLIVLIILVIIGGIYFGTRQTPTPGTTGQTGLNYGTTTGSSASSSPASTTLKTYTDNALGISYEYPETLGLQYIGTVDWPPKISTFRGTLSCSQTSSDIATSQLKTYDGRQYCVTVSTQGAAGNLYSSYTYKTVVGGQGFALTFSVHKAQCANYEEPQKSECQNEESRFNPDDIVKQVIQTIKING